MKRETRFNRRENPEFRLTPGSDLNTNLVGFSTPEEALRRDAAEIRVPASVEARLEQAIARESPARRSWWRRLFGG